MKTLHPQSNHLNYIKVTPWMELSEEDMFVLRMDKVITMTECKDQDLLRFINNILMKRMTTIL